MLFNVDGRAIGLQILVWVKSARDVDQFETEQFLDLGGTGCALRLQFTLLLPFFPSRQVLLHQDFPDGLQVEKEGLRYRVAFPESQRHRR